MNLRHGWRLLGFGSVGALLAWDIVRTPEGVRPIIGIFGTDPLGIPTVFVAAAVAFALILPLMGMIWCGIDLAVQLRRLEGRLSHGKLAIVLAAWRNWANPEVRRLSRAMLGWLALFVVTTGVWIAATAAAGV